MAAPADGSPLEGAQVAGDVDAATGGPTMSAAPHGSNLTCPQALETVALTSLEFILPTVTLGMLNIVVIVGNALVIGAVFTSAKLRTTTNGFVCSLAVADLLVGLMVLPFSNANEVLRYWVFGPIWCSVWLAVDVWLCTASILNLVAISFDRYIAISRPFKYHSLLSPKKGKFLVGFVWILSFVICFPPLIGWNEQGKGLGNRFGGADGESGGSGHGLHPGYNGSGIYGNLTMNSTGSSGDFLWGSGSGDDGGLGSGGGGGNTPLGFEASAENLYVVKLKHVVLENYTYMYGGRHNASLHGDNLNLHLNPRNSNVLPNPRTDLDSCDLRFPECLLTSDPGYIVYSALGSFWIPMMIMCAFYWKIYRTAVKSTAALKHGMLTTKAGTELSSSGTGESVTLRIHRGGGGGVCRTSDPNGSGVGGGKRRSGPPSSYPKCHYRSSFNPHDSTSISDTDTVFINTHNTSHSRSKKYRDPRTSSSGGRNGKHKDVRLGNPGPQPDFPLLGKHPDDGPDYFNLKVKHKKRSKFHLRGRSEKDRSLVESLTDEEQDLNGSAHCATNNSSSSHSHHTHPQHHETKTMAFLRKSRRKNFKLELQKLNKEKKAAKTVGIIVGCFILCWLPFFTVYLLGAFWPDSTPPLLFSIFFWLGYCNSAINPCVYALFSRDFRCAFKKLLRCNCRIEPRHKHQLGFVSRLHSFRMQASSRSNESNSE